jgi:long-subunit acyl-CoA synthetase (AMP-forming)
VELLKDVNQTLDPHEHLRFMVVVNEPWTIENDFLTPTMKLKRNVVEDAYRKKVDDWYAQEKTVIWE